MTQHFRFRGFSVLAADRLLETFKFFTATKQFQEIIDSNEWHNHMDCQGIPSYKAYELVKAELRFNPSEVEFIGEGEWSPANKEAAWLWLSGREMNRLEEELLDFNELQESGATDWSGNDAE